MIPHDQNVVLEMLEKLLSKTSVFHTWSRKKVSGINKVNGDREIRENTIPDLHLSDGDYAWLKDFINLFIHAGGVEALEKRLGDVPPATCSMLAALLRPFNSLKEFLNEEGKMLFSDVCDRGMTCVKKQKLADLKGKDNDALAEVINALKLLSDPEQRQVIDDYIPNGSRTGADFDQQDVQREDEHAQGGPPTLQGRRLLGVLGELRGTLAEPGSDACLDPRPEDHRCGVAGFSACRSLREAHRGDSTVPTAARWPDRG